jgi:hypothetical protein
VYPGPEVLQELGRITIAGSRLDLAMAGLWHHLDRNVPYEQTRKRGGSEQDRWIRLLASVRLEDPLRRPVLDALSTAAKARERRNEIVHQDWVLYGPEGLRVTSDQSEVPPEEQAAQWAAWQRQARDSERWQRVPARKVTVEDAPSLDELISVERALTRATDAIVSLTFHVASSRVVGEPPGYVHPEASDKP